MDSLFTVFGAATLPILFVLGGFLLSWVKVLNEYERGVKFRLGRVVPEPVGPGLTLVIFPPAYERLVTIDMRTMTLAVPPQEVITRDNISVKVSAVVYFRVTDPLKAVLEVEDYRYATSQIAQTTLRNMVGQVELDELLSHRDVISNKIQAIADEMTAPWGVKITIVELKDVEIPADMQRVIGRQAEAERERRAKIISAEGEFQAAEKLVAAAQMMEQNPMSLQMRYMQTLTELGAQNKNTSTIVFPLPMELLAAFKALGNTLPKQ